MTASITFYEALGLTLIVDSAPNYVRFEFPSTEIDEPATLSLHQPRNGWVADTDQPLIYFEMDDLDVFLESLIQHNITPLVPAQTQSYLWREADILDPSGNKIRLFQAGENRRFPPWRIDGQTE